MAEGFQGVAWVLIFSRCIKNPLFEVQAADFVMWLFTDAFGLTCRAQGAEAFDINGAIRETHAFDTYTTEW